MATYYVGSGGNDSNAGTSWALRKLTLTGAEDIPVAANDTVYVGPGTYAETLVCDVSGSAGNPITYIADKFGENTDGIGGVVRVTGSDDDETPNRSFGFQIATRNYRTFRGFLVDSTNSLGVQTNGGTHFVIEDCSFVHNVRGIGVQGASTDGIIRRCYFGCNGNDAVYFTGSIIDADHLVENCIMVANTYRGVNSSGVGGVDIDNCLMAGNLDGVRVVSLPGSYVACTINNSIVINHTSVGLEAGVAGMLTEDYNTVAQNISNYQNVTPGANSNTYLPQLEAPFLLDGYQYPWWYGKLSEYSSMGSITGTGVPSDDIFGITRAGSPSSWGPIEYTDSPARRDISAGESRGRRGT